MIATLEEAPVTRIISGEELDKTICEAYALGNHVRRKLIMALNAMDTSRLYLTLGFSSIFQYGEKRLRCRKSEMYDFLRVARALAGLPIIDKAFETGALTWSDAREITKVAREDTQDDWIEFAHERSLAELEAEVKDARRKGRHAPRRDRHGLPNLTTRVLFELEPHENDKLAKAFAKAAAEMGTSLGDGRVEPKDALLFLVEQFLASDPACSQGGGRVAREDSVYTVLYQRCPECGKAHLPTPEGRIEIPGEVVDRVEGEARKVVIAPGEEHPTASEPKPAEQVPLEKRDRPNWPALVNKVILRDGRTCANPRCGRTLGLQAHHIHFRVNGGATALWNECAVCSTCHSLIHAGLLRVEGDPQGGLKWIPKCEDSDFSLSAELARATTVAEVHVKPLFDGGSGNSTAVENENSTAVETPRLNENSTGVGNPTAVEFSQADTDDLLTEALIGVGCTEKDARRRLAIARARLATEGREATEQNLMVEALRAGRR